MDSEGTRKGDGLGPDASIQSTCTELDGWLKSVDKSVYLESSKHGYTNMVFYAVPITTVETLERRVSSYLRRWLGLPRSLSSLALYGNTNKLHLPFKSLEEEFKVTRAREGVHLIRGWLKQGSK